MLKRRKHLLLPICIIFPPKNAPKAAPKIPDVESREVYKEASDSAIPKRGSNIGVS